MSQTYASHRRLDPWYHYFLVPIALLFFVGTILHRPHGHPVLAVVHAILAAAAIVVVLKVRSYALRVQDRVIRLEETLRMQAILPGELKAELPRLTPGQFVALRFASDGELAARVEEALREGLKGEEIKKRIQVWRPDEFRV